MSRLRVFAETAPEAPEREATEGREIAQALAAAGIRFERWRTDATIEPGAPPARVLEAFRSDIERLKAEGGYSTVDVVSLAPDHPERAALRKKFLDEHVHVEDEVRFFVAGRGLFCLHVGDQVLEVLCEAGDLISVPRGTRHWFDMGPAPSFVAIRLFLDPAGWVASPTGSEIASRFGRLE